MSQSLKMMLTIDRLVTALVCEDHMLQGWLWTSEMTILGDKIFQIYQNLFDEWNKEGGKGGKEENRVWEAKVFSRDGVLDSQYIIDLIYSSSDGRPIDSGIVIVKKFGGTLVIEFSGSLIPINYTRWYDANTFFTGKSEDEKKDFLSKPIKRNT
jgi:hypothetical protein